MDQEATEFVKDTLHFELKTENNAHIFEVIQTYVRSRLGTKNPQCVGSWTSKKDSDFEFFSN